MKGLSIEEKAKAYDKAIEKFDVILNLDIVKESGTIFADDVRKIFPELKESEDERIKKAIHNALKYLETEQSWDFLDDVDILDAYAWLEKQGSKKSVDELTQQGENKPTDKIEQMSIRSEDDKNTIKVLMNIIKKSEMIDPFIYTDSLKEKLYDWLKSLRPQNQQESIEGKANNFFDALGDCGYVQDEILRLKFIWKQAGLPQPQSQWKPSEEMLEALYRVIPENVMEKSEDDMLLDKLYQGLKYGKVLSEK